MNEPKYLHIIWIADIDVTGYSIRENGFVNESVEYYLYKDIEFDSTSNDEVLEWTLSFWIYPTVIYGRESAKIFQLISKEDESSNYTGYISIASKKDIYHHWIIF